MHHFTLLLAAWEPCVSDIQSQVPTHSHALHSATKSFVMMKRLKLKTLSQEFSPVTLTKRSTQMCALFLLTMEQKLTERVNSPHQDSCSSSSTALKRRFQTSREIDHLKKSKLPLNKEMETPPLLALYNQFISELAKARGQMESLEHRKERTRSLLNTSVSDMLVVI